MSATSSPFSRRIGRFRKGSKQGDPESPISPETPVTPHSSQGLLDDRVESEPPSPLVGYPYQQYSAKAPPVFFVPEPSHYAIGRQIKTNNGSQVEEGGIELQDMKSTGEATNVVFKPDSLSDQVRNPQPISSGLNGLQEIWTSDPGVQERSSIEFSSRGLDISSDPGPGDPQSSSSAFNQSTPSYVYDLAASMARRRNGTPPGLYGTRAVQNRLSAFSFQTSGADVQSWETVEASRNVSTETDRVEDHAGRSAVITTGWAGSSLADNSDAGSISPPKPTPAKPALEAAFADSLSDFQFFRRTRARNSLIHPAYRTQNESDAQNLRELGNNNNNTPRNTYRHPAPLSASHANPFVSSPPLFRTDREMTEEAMLGSPATQSPSVNELKVEQRAEPMPSKSGITESNTSQLNASFVKVNVVSSRANITGTFAGLGAREVGSSLADGSSPTVMLSSSPYQESDSPFTNHHTGSNEESEVHSPLKNMPRRRYTHDGSLEMGRIAGPDNFYKRAQSPESNAYSSDSDEVDSVISEAGSLFSGNFGSVPDTDYRQALIDHSLLTKPPTPPLPEEQRLSVPLELMRSLGSTKISQLHLGEDRATSSSSVMVENIEMQRLEPNTNMQMRVRSPQRIERLLAEGRMTSGHPETIAHTANPMVNTGTDCTIPGVDVRHTDPQPPIPPPEFHHLLRTSSEIREIQIRWSRIAFALCIMMPPTLLMYGHGYMDGTCLYLSGNVARDFDKHYKVVALVFGYAFFVGVFVAIGLGFWAI